MTGAIAVSQCNFSVRAPSGAEIVAAASKAPQPQGVVATPNSVVANGVAARQPCMGTSLDLPAASSGVAGLSDCIPLVDPRVEAMICELESRGFFVAEMKTITLRTIAASESVSKSTSLVGA